MVHQQVAPVGGAAFSLDAPLALPNNNNNNQTNGPQQYSPQTSLYQQQLIKSAQQFIQPHHQQQQQQLANNARLFNGNQLQENQQHSPSQQQQIYSPKFTNQTIQQQQQVGPIYAAKSAYYPQQQHQQLGGSPSNQLYQTTRPTTMANGANLQSYSFQQNHSPNMSSLMFQSSQQVPQAAARQLPMTNSLLNLSPGQQQQQQLVSNQSSWPEQMLQYQSQQQISLNNLWQQQQMQDSFQRQQQQVLAVQQAPVLVGQQRSRPIRDTQAAKSLFSDRDSISTISRANGMQDDRRSFTMRSQFTVQYNNNNNSNNNNQNKSRHFSFVQLTGEALRHLLGLGQNCRDLATTSKSGSGRQPLLSATGGQLGENLRLASNNNNNSNEAKTTTTTITAIDSGEDYYFKRKVFKYRLFILRLVNFLLSSLVLLSPVVMLLLPKMEPLFRSSSQLNQDEQQQFQASSGTTVTHGLGLNHKLASNNHARTLANGQQVANQQQWRISECNSSDCDGPLVGFVLRLIMLTIAHWAIFFRQQTVTLPRIDVQRCLLIGMTLLVTLAYWLFFIFRVFDKRYNDFELHYMTIIQFSISMLETLILLHYLALVLIELRQRRKVYCIKVVRSPDGASKYYTCGELSIQQCGQFVLENYHQDFKNFNAYSEHLLNQESELASLFSVKHSSRSRPSTSSRRQSRASSPANDHDEHRARSSNSRHRSHRRARRRHSSRRNSDASDIEDQRLQDESQKLEQQQQVASAAKRNRRNSSSEEDEREENNKEKKARGRESSSSDATSSQKMKESSLETVRAVETTTSGQQVALSSNDLAISEQANIQQQTKTTAAEVESVRSGRSRRSTGSRLHKRHHHHHHSHHSHHSRSRSRGRHDEDDEQEQEDQENQATTTTTGVNLDGELGILEEHERKLRRRKLRLLASVQDAFAQVGQLDEETILQQQQQQQQNESTSVTIPGTGAIKQPIGMDANQAARSMYPTIARSLQKYLRLTKQTGRHNLQSIYEHLSKCLLYQLNARAFLEKFINLDPVWQQNETKLFAQCRLMNQDSFGLGSNNYYKQMKQASSEPEINTWSLICDTLLSRQIDSGTFFLLRQGQISLLVTVARLPHLNLTEQVIDQNLCRYSLSANRETTSV